MKITTVRGDIPPQEAGIILPHEHVLIDLTCYFEQPSEKRAKALASQKVLPSNYSDLKRNPMLVKDNIVLSSVAEAAEDLALFAQAGGKTVVDATTEGIGRDPRALKRISELTGVNIVAGSGFYVNISHPARMKRWTVDRIREEIVRDLQEGIGNTKIRSGVIGEVGVSSAKPDEAETRSLRASARAQIETGAGLIFHASPTPAPVPTILDILEREGADLSKVAASHRDSLLQHYSEPVRTKHYSEIADRGAYIEFDCFGAEFYFSKMGEFATYSQPKDFERVREIARLANLGYGRKILVSMDMCMKMYLKKYGGYGWEHIPRNIAPMMQEAGLRSKDIRMILEDNPRDLLSF